MKPIFSININIFILSIIDCCVNICTLAFFLNCTGSLTNTHYLASLFWLGMVISDLPMGYLADYLGPKKVFLFCILLRAIAFLIFYMSENYFSLLALANFIAGISVSFMYNVYLMQIGLLENKYSIKINNQVFLLNNLIFKSLGFIIGCLIAYFIINVFSLKYIWIVSIIFSAILFFATAFLWDSINSPSQKSPFAHLKLSMELIIKRPKLKESILTNSLITLFTCLFYNNWIVFFVPKLEKNPNNFILAFICFFIIKFTSVVFWKKTKLINYFTISKLLMVFYACILLFAFEMTLLNIIAFVFTIFTLSAVEVLIKKAILENLAGNQSGTILSIYSILENLTGTLGLFIGGYFLKDLSIPKAWILFATFVFISFLIAKNFVYLTRRDRERGRALKDLANNLFKP